MLAARKPHIQIVHRPGTQDEVIFREVLVQNCYRLPEKFPPRQIIIDIGAHIGIFSVACLLRGAQEVWCWEPDPDNFTHLQTNLGSFIGAKLHNAAVWRSDQPGAMTFSGYSEGMNACGTCLPNFAVNGVRRNLPVATVSLDDVIRAASLRGNRRIALLKIDCEGAEYPALYTCSALDLVDRIVGECHELDGIAKVMTVPGFQKYDMQEMADFLEEEGFDVTTQRQDNHKLSLFWASRHKTPQEEEA